MHGKLFDLGQSNKIIVLIGGRKLSGDNCWSKKSLIYLQRTPVCDCHRTLFPVKSFLSQ